MAHLSLEVYWTFRYQAELRYESVAEKDERDHFPGFCSRKRFSPMDGSFGLSFRCLYDHAAPRTWDVSAMVIQIVLGLEREKSSSHSTDCALGRETG